MTKTGKRYEWEVGVESGIPLMATIQDLRLGRRGAARPDRPGVVHPADRRLEEGARLRRPVLVAHPEQLAQRCSDQGLTRARELVAGDLPAGVRGMEGAPGPQGAGVRRDVRGAAGGLEGRDGECLMFHVEHAPDELHGACEFYTHSRTWPPPDGHMANKTWPCRCSRKGLSINGLRFPNLRMATFPGERGGVFVRLTAEMRVFRFEDVGSHNGPCIWKKRTAIHVH